jgi:hypothetical protein
MGAIETDISNDIVGSEVVATQCKPLSPAFRMAAMIGGLESVRLHLRAGSDVDAVDEKGRSALILAASKGHFEICRLLLEAGADPALKDSGGKDALAAAFSRGRTEIAELLRSAKSRNGSGVKETREQEFSRDASGIDPDINATRTVANTLKDHRARADELDANAKKDASGNAILPPAWPEGEEAFDLSVWQEEAESPPPPDDPTCADAAGVLQNAMSRHVPIDTDETWDDVEIDLPELAHLGLRRIKLTGDAWQKLRTFVLEALRDGRVRADRVVDVVPEGEGIGDPERAEIEAALQLVLGELAAVVDDDLLAPDEVIEADENDEERFGEAATDALNFIGAYQESMRNWPGFESGGIRDHVIRYLPRDHLVFAEMGQGAEYPEAHATAVRITQRKARKLGVREGTKAYQMLHESIVPPYDVSKFPNRWWKLRPDWPVRTLTAHIGKDTYSHIHWDSDQARTISVREAARLQSFPDGFVFQGAMNAAFRQIGNAVPPLMAACIAKIIRDTLNNATSSLVSPVYLTASQSPNHPNFQCILQAPTTGPLWRPKRRQRCTPNGI